MCTVSYLNVDGRAIITSNRDEKVKRPSATAPETYSIKGKNIVFPKDPKAGGTWFAVDEHGTAIVLLNGADEKHQMRPSYSKSRGLIVLEIISGLSAKESWENINLSEIEPFTLVLFQNAELFQLRWNGIYKETLALNPHENYIWSSSTLYSKEARNKRSDWFHSFMAANPVISEQNMIRFHRYRQEDNQENGLVINRDGQLKTLSITQAVIEKKKVGISHIDLILEKEDSLSYDII